MGSEHEGRIYKNIAGHRCPHCASLAGTVDVEEYRICTSCERAFRRQRRHQYIGLDYGSTIDDIVVRDMGTIDQRIALGLPVDDDFYGYDTQGYWDFRSDDALRMRLGLPVDDPDDPDLYDDLS